MCMSYLQQQQTSDLNQVIVVFQDLGVPDLSNHVCNGVQIGQQLVIP